MKKICIIMLVVLFPCCLSACGSIQEKTDSLVTILNSEPYQRSQAEKSIRKLHDTTELQNALIKKLIVLNDNSDFAGCYKLVSRLDDLNYKNSFVKEQFLMCLKSERQRAFQQGNSDLLTDYIEQMRCFLPSFYCDEIDCFPYDEMTAAIRSNCDLVIVETGRGGYYDIHEGEEDDESYWWSPLFKVRAREGEVGYQQITIENLYAGDFDVVIRSEVFYGTKPSDYGNSLGAKLYYKGNYVMGNYEQIRDFLELCVPGSTFCCSDNKGNGCFFILGKDRISILQDRIFDIVYQ